MYPAPSWSDFVTKRTDFQVLTIGQMVYQFMTKLDWFSTLFPRIPVPIQKQIEKRIEQYCREQGITVSQLSTGRPPAGTGAGAGAGGGGGGAAQEGEYQDYDASGGAGLVGDRGGGGGRGHAMMGSGSRTGNAYPPPMNNYRNDHDDRDYYAPTSGSSYGRGGRGGYEDYPPAPLERERDRDRERERDRDRDRDREKDYDRHRSKHKKKHKHRQSSRSRSRSRSRHRSERHERKREGVAGYERSSRSRHNDHYEERDRRYRWRLIQKREKQKTPIRLHP